MIAVCWSPKGGSGTSVVAAGLAIASADTHRTVIVDFAGDVPAILALGDLPIGLSEWIAEPSAFDLHDLMVECTERLRVLPRGHSTLPEARSGAWSRLMLELQALSTQGCSIVVDAGIGPVPQEIATISDHDYLVVRPCYLALRRARLFDDSRRSVIIDGSRRSVIVVSEPNRVLTTHDIESVLGSPVVTDIRLDPDIARRVDAGVIARRPPVHLMERLTPIVQSWFEP